MPGDIVDDAIGGAQLKSTELDAEKTLRKLSVDKPPMILEDGLEDFPSIEDIATLRRVADHIPLKLFTIAFIEAAERFSYYGTIIVCK